ncbi:mitochondrial 54S ribosomal protein YmL35 [Coemansia sp. RSA 2711]|nr:mitochondrial 54S ribosomal protein YmL35 [Coemansia sp. RSA 2711]KAJ2317257.1 mitochondrial 54S ribosomal protein YmL35 [Coemansia sp. RSA 2704]
MHALYRTFAARALARRTLVLRSGSTIRHQSTYKQPATGVNPAYDEALKVIEAYSSKKAREAEAAAAELKRAQDSGADSAALGLLQQKWFDLAVESRINDGEVLWNARQGNYDLSQPVYQHLKREAWRGRPLEILMQRLLQMYVLPDMLDPRVVGTPESQLHISLGGQPAIEPGSAVDPADARAPPAVELVTFDETPRLHTLAMLDLDAPCEAEQTFREQFHWIVSNLSFSLGASKADVASGTELLAYVPPHPAHGTPAHRYVVVALEQGDGGQSRVDGAEVSRDMTMREFVAEHGLRVAGISFFRAAWNESVDEVYRDVLGQPAPRYGPMPTPSKHIGPDGREINKYANY